jgi:L,D-peptidoglycan transpeptidase YkuD (ErfK/YbiS/YcfS/YnhG family)
LLLVLGCGPTTSAQVPAPSPVPPATSQLLTGIAARWDSTQITLRLWRRTPTGWQPIGEPWPAVVGTRGLAPVGDKQEGDGKSPAGVLRLRHVYGYAPAAPPGARLTYTPVDPSWECVDDPRSAHYARVLDRRTVATPDWRSSEHMQQDDDFYRLVIDTEFNTAPNLPARGSCIFLHVWAGPSSTTDGCTAMAEPALAHLVSMLDPDAGYVLLPHAEYEAMIEPWGLPRQ